MTERLIIQDFAGITYIAIEIKEVNVLIGPQASGKSICAKLLFYFKNFVTDILSSLDEAAYSKRYIDTERKLKFLEYFPMISWGEKPFLIRYENADSFIEITSLKKKQTGIKLEYSDNYKKLINSLKKFRVEILLEQTLTPHQLEKEVELQRGKILKFVEGLMGDSFLASQIFIPAGRSIFSIVQRSIFSFLAQKDELDPFLIHFGSLYQFVKRMQNRTFPDKLNVDMEKLAEEVVCGKYLELSNEDFIRMHDGRLVNLTTSSSGQQETLPLTMILTSLSKLRGFRDSKTVYIEEPEAHIFPSAQRSLVELIAAAFNFDSGRTQFFITTHSPYVLTVFNNLIQAGLLYEELPEESRKELELIIPKHKALSSERMQVYSLESGYCRSIISEETGLIDATIIDQVSDDLSIEFDQLLDLIDIK